MRSVRLSFLKLETTRSSGNRSQFTYRFPSFYTLITATACSAAAVGSSPSPPAGCPPPFTIRGHSILLSPPLEHCSGTFFLSQIAIRCCLPLLVAVVGCRRSNTTPHINGSVKIQDTFVICFPISMFSLT
ncbi:unnamed protein product [Victoria cruziana]